MSDITIPAAAIEAVAEQFARSEHSMPLDQLPEIVQLRLRNNARAACLAMLEAWPGGAKATLAPYIILPLPKENPDDNV